MASWPHTPTAQSATRTSARADQAAAAQTQFDSVLAGRVRSGRPLVVDVCAEAVCVAAPAHQQLAVFMSERLFQDRKGPSLADPDAVVDPLDAVDSDNPNLRSGAVTAARFGHSRRPLRLFTCSKSALVVWSWIGDASGGSADASHKFSSRILREDVGLAHHLAVHHADTLVAACVRDVVVVVAVTPTGSDAAPAVCLQGHASRVVTCEFFPRRSSSLSCADWLLTVSEDRTFKIWDAASPSCIYSSPILGQCPITAVAFDPVRPVFAIGAEDALVRFFDPTPRTPGAACEPRLMQSMDIAALSRKWIDANSSTKNTFASTDEIKIVSSLPSWRRPPHRVSSPSTAPYGTPAAAERASATSESDDSVQHAFCILNIFYPRMTTNDNFVDKNSGTMLAPPARLLVACPMCIAIVDPNSYALLHLIDFSRPNLNMEMFESHDPSKSITKHRINHVNNHRTPSHRDHDAILPAAQVVLFAEPAGIKKCWFVAIGHALVGSVTLLRIHETSLVRLPPISPSSSITSAQKTTSARQSHVTESGQDNLVADTVRKVVEKHLVGKKWVDNVVGDCMKQLAMFGVYEVHDLPALFQSLDMDDQKTGHVDEYSDDAMPMLPLYVERELKELAASTNSGSSSMLSLIENPNDPVHPSSVLKTADMDKTKILSPSTRQSRNSRPNPLDKPLTFRSKVKSSGYTEGPKVTKMFSGTPSKSFVKSKTSISGPDALARQSYPCHCGPPTRMAANAPITVVPHASGMTSVRFHPSGRFLATAASDKCARFYRMNTSKTTTISREKAPTDTPSRDFVGHDAAVTDLCWRTQPIKSVGHVLLTTSMDGRVRLWGTERTDPLLVISPSASTPTRRVVVPRGSVASMSKMASLSSSSVSSPSMFTKSPPSPPPAWQAVARFFYQDRFLVTAAGPRIDMYSYHLAHSDPSVIRSPSYSTSSGSSRHRSAQQLPGFDDSTTARIVGSLDVDAQGVTAIACANTFASRIVLAATSDRRILLWDVGANAVVREWTNTHTRSAHWLSVADYGYSHASTSAMAPFDHVFVSAAVGDGIKIWDMRSPAPSLTSTATMSSSAAVMHLTGHTNRQLNLVRCAVSPCARFVAVGSEDHHAYIYDVRTGLVVTKTKKGSHTNYHGGAVTDVAFHPTMPSLATACLDGKLGWFIVQDLRSKEYEV